MLIILEGPDCARKTTLAQDIVARLSRTDPNATIELLHRGPPSGHPLDEYVVPLLDYRPGMNRHIICDRWHWGEYVYPRVLRRESKMDIPIFRYIEMFLTSRGAITVLLNPPIADLQECMRLRGDDTIRENQLPAIIDSYEVIADGLSSTWCLRPPESRITPDSVIATARGRERLAVPLNRFVTPVGSAAPDTILFGDIRSCVGVDCGHNTHHSPNGTAFMPYPGTSGDYLMHALEEYEINREYVMLANACDVDDSSQITTATRADVVALGRNAHLFLTAHEIRHATVPHPQFIRRFHHTASAAYGKLIQGVIRTERNELTWRP